jgi:DNA-nicking Smr family endonuclease
MHGRLPNHRRPRQPTAEELALWRHAVRDTRPLGSTAAPAAPVPPAPQSAPLTAVVPERHARRPAAPLPPPAARASRQLDPRGPVDLDRRTWQRLRRGTLPIEARLDLHGMTQAEAHAALTAFLALAQARGARCVLVITGRGLPHGTLRGAAPRWLDEPPNRARVVTYAGASTRHGGDGALYVLLRRKG